MDMTERLSRFNGFQEETVKMLSVVDAFALTIFHIVVRHIKDNFSSRS
jgi:hypothetical protein